MTMGASDEIRKSFTKVLKESLISEKKAEPVNIVLEGSYKEAYEIILDAYECKLHVALIGPPGSGKTLLCRKIAYDLGKPFFWVTFSELVRSSTLIGSFDPVLAFQEGFSSESFIPGPFTLAVLVGGIFFANEINRGDEFTLNTLLDALEERRLYIPQLRSWVKVHEDFFFISAMNPSELRGTRRLPAAIKDRIKVWIKIDYPPADIEKKIIIANTPEYQIPPHFLDVIIDLVRRLREDPDVETPPSLRTSIALARFVAQRAKRLGKQITYEDIAYAARCILVEAIEPRAGISAENIVRGAILDVLGIE